MVDEFNRNHDTRHLHLNADTAPMRDTDPLDQIVPWVVELRIIGTADVIQMRVHEPIVLGRGDKRKDGTPDIDLEPHQAYLQGVSRRHMEIAPRGNRIVIRDLSSANGTYLNGGKLDPTREYRLRHGDHLSLGKLEMQVAFVVMPSSHQADQEDAKDAPAIPRIGSGQWVLIVDDDREVAHAVGSALEQAGFETIVVRSVTEALTQIDERLPAAIVMELMLPDRSGLEIVHYVRERHEALPLVVITGATGGYQMGQAVEAGIDVFLTKPVGIDELIRGFGKIIPQMTV